MPDTTIPLQPFGGGVWGFQVPDTGEILVKAVRATFDGSGIAGAWFPAVQVIAPGNVTDGEYPTAASVAAGGSATVDFFPGAEEATSSAPPVTTGGLPNAAMIKTNTQTVAGNSVTQVTLSSGTFATTDSSIFTASGSNVVIHETGLYAAYIHFVDDNAATDPTTTEFYPKWLGATLGANAPWQQIVPRMFNVNGPAGLQGGDPIGGGLVDSIANYSIAYVSELNATVGAWIATLSASTIKTSTCLLNVVQLQPISAATLAVFPTYPF